MKFTPRCFQHAAPHVSAGFVPQSRLPSREDVIRLQKFVTDAKRILVLSGAGLSTESGIPDYRSEGVGLYARTSHRPMQYKDFISSQPARQRYWARNFVGWPKFSLAQPNIAHHCLHDWQKKGKVQQIVTQNVDALHTKAGSSDVIELHGCTHRVKCLSCHRLTRRLDLQHRFEALNPTWDVVDVPIGPDGDVLLQDDQVKGFKVPGCSKCGGVLMPDVTFFGDNVPRPLVDMVYGLVDSSDALIAVGTSLYVYSGYRFVVRAAEKKIPIAIVNIGKTKGDDLACVKLEVPCGSILPHIEVS